MLREEQMGLFLPSAPHSPVFSRCDTSQAEQQRFLLVSAPIKGKGQAGSEGELQSSA